jgi:hypothetical protein
MCARKRTTDCLIVAERLVPHGRLNLHGLDACRRRDTPEYSARRGELHGIVRSDANDVKRAERGCTNQR